MKGYHFTIIFVLIAIGMLTIKDNQIREQISITKYKTELNTYFNNAVDDGTKHLIQSTKKNLEINKEYAVDAFLNSMYVSLGILDNSEAQKKMQAYLPVVMVTEDDGFYIRYSDEFKVNSYYEVSTRWSEKIPYFYEDNDFIYNFSLNESVTIIDKNGLLGTTNRTYKLDYNESNTSEIYKRIKEKLPDNIMFNKELFLLTKRNSIILRIEEYLTYYVNMHNRIAQHYGISYTFTMPIIDNSELVRSINSPSLIIIFQGYPYHGIENEFNLFSVAGAEIAKGNAYYIEQVDNYFIYHKRNCPIFHLDENAKKYYSKEECAKAGAYACRECNPNTGVYSK